MENSNRGVGLYPWMLCCVLLLVAAEGCTAVRDSLFGPGVSSRESVTKRSAVAGWSGRRVAAKPTSAPSRSRDAFDDRQGDAQDGDVQDGDAQDGDVQDRATEGRDVVLEAPYVLNVENIIRQVYKASPSLRASREEKEAAQHQLVEFKANLSRLEPFVEVRGDTTKFPKRRDVEGRTGEVVGGIEKETFEGAIFRLEGGASASQFKFGEVEQGQDDVESGSGALIRARVEVPFVGSRRRQERVIAQAFQESTARNAELSYVSNYRLFVETALTYYWTGLLYHNYERAYDQQLLALESLRNDRRVPADDHSTIESAQGAATVLRDQYAMFYRDSVTSLLSALGIDLNAEYMIQEPIYRPSEYIERSSTVAGMEQMLAEAYENNPKFEVLTNAIADADLQRTQAIAGKLDVTAFVEGTHFPVGSETFDDRVAGWQVNAGVTVRLNDQRVLGASRRKAEAQIRQFKAEIEAEQRKIEQEIVTQTDRLRANDAIRHGVLDVIRKTRAEYMERSREYLNGNEGDLTIDDVIRPLKNLTTAEVRLASNVYRSGNSEAALLASTGRVYRLVGMKID